MTGRRFAACALAVPLTATGSLLLFRGGRASAGSASLGALGAEAMGVLFAGDDCPIEVESEKLSITVPEFPSADFTAENFPAYRPSVTAEYTFRNPTEEDYTATMLFPFGAAPGYVPSGFDFYGDLSSRAVKEDGEKVAVTSRYSYCPYAAKGFDMAEGIMCLSGEKSAAFFGEDTPVTVHTYRVVPAKARSEKKNDWAFLELTLKADPARTRVATGEWSSKCIEKGCGVILYGFDAASTETRTFSVYVFGEDVPLGAALYASRQAGTPLAGATVSEVGTASYDFASFVAARYPEDVPTLPREDWYDGFAEALEKSTVCGIFCDVVPDKISACDFMRWYEYGLEFPAGRSVKNEITAPIYPTIREDGTFEYTYLLSPSSRWADFGRLEVDIDTPYILTESSLEFEAREGGYSLVWEEGLPLGELTFTLAESEEGSAFTYRPYESGLSPAALAGILVGAACGTAGIAAAVYFAVFRRRKAEQGKTTEGKIDLPPKDGKGL